MLQREPGTEAPFLEFIQRVCAQCSDGAQTCEPIRPGCGGFGIRNFLTLFLSIEVSKAMLDSQQAAEEGREAEAAFHNRRVTLFTDPGNPELRMVGGYFFIANGRLTPNAMSVRRLAYNFSDTHAYFCKVQFTLVNFGSAMSDDEIVRYFKEQVEDIMVDLMPQVMRLLPDWPEYEALARSGT